MKTQIKIAIAVFVSSFYSYAQEGIEVPFNTVIGIPSGTYVKDIDNKLLPYVGTWEGEWDGKKFTLVIEKRFKEINMSESGYYYYEDRLVGKYKITTLSNNVVIANNLNEQNYNLMKIRNSGSGKNNALWMLYLDKDLCSVTASFVLRGNPATNQLEYRGFLQDEYWNSQGCQFAGLEDIYNLIPIPKVNLVLTR